MSIFAPAVTASHYFAVILFLMGAVMFLWTFLDDIKRMLREEKITPENGAERIINLAISIGMMVLAIGIRLFLQ